MVLPGVRIREDARRSRPRRPRRPKHFASPSRTSTRTGASFGPSSARGSRETRLATLQGGRHARTRVRRRSAEVGSSRSAEHSSKRAAEWIPGCAIEVLTEGKLRYFWKRHDAGWDDPMVEPEYDARVRRAPEKVIATDENARELVKWAGEGYDEATWDAPRGRLGEAVASAAAATRARLVTSPGGGKGKGKGKGKAARRVSSGGDKAEGFERADEPPADAGDVGGVGRRLRGTPIEGGGNAGIARSFASADPDAFRARGRLGRGNPRGAPPSGAARKVRDSLRATSSPRWPPSPARR